jgi:tetratricopeptide (TPR) repeat protein
MDAQPRVEELLGRLRDEPDVVRAALEELHESYAPHPHVSMALTVCRYRAGAADDALELAREALPLCFERGHFYLAAEIFRELRAVMDQLELNRDQVLTIAKCLTKMDDLVNAAKAYSAVLNTDPGEIRAVKGLLKVADDILHQKDRPQAAARVYRFLLQRCGGSPLAEFMQRGLEEAEHRGATV